MSMQGIVFTSFIVLIMMAIWGPDYNEPNPCITYNEMRQIHIETSGEYGWPKGAIKECEHES